MPLTLQSFPPGLSFLDHALEATTKNGKITSKHLPYLWVDACNKHTPSTEATGRAQCTIPASIARILDKNYFG